MNGITDTIKHLLIINVILYISMSLIPSLYDILALHFPKNEGFYFWQVISHMFMHSPQFLIHIVFNMLALWMFGTPLEQMWGRKKFLFFYFSAGLGAVFLPWIIDFYQFNDFYQVLSRNGLSNSDIYSILNTRSYGEYFDKITLSKEELKQFYDIFNTSSVGASGAIMGLLAAYGLNFPNAKLALIFLPVPIAAKYFIPILLIYETLSEIFGWSSIFGMNIAHFAHIGGAIIGFILAYYWKNNQFKH